MKLPTLIDDTLLRCQSMLAASPEGVGLRPLTATTLEHRILLNAAPVDASLPEVGQDADAHSGLGSDELADVIASLSEQVVTRTQQKTGQSSADEAVAAWSASEDAHDGVRRELVFVDMSIPDAASLLSELWSIDDDSRDLEVVLIKASEDGLDKITSTLAERDDRVDAVHILSHGSGAAVQLGNVWLTSDVAAERAEQIASWSLALEDSADLLFYGCELAETTEGQSLLQDMAQLTGADIAASTDDTGAAALGGDWVLEYRDGDHETDSLTLVGWDALLAAPVAVDDYYHVDQIVGLTIDATNGVLANDTGAGLTAVLVAGPSDATSFTLNPDGSFSYTPTGSTGVDSFTYFTTDGTDSSANATVQINRQPSTGGLSGSVEQLAVASSNNVRSLTTTGGHAAAALPDGRYVVVYTEDIGGGDLDVFAQRYNADGTLIGTPLSVGVFTSETQHQVTVSAKVTAAYPNGLFTVAYTDVFGGASDVYLASYRFDTGGSISNATLANTDGGDQYDVAVDHLTSGEFAAVRATEGVAASSSGAAQILLDLYPTSGLSLLQSEFAVSDLSDGRAHTRPSLVATVDGGFAVVWQSSGARDSVSYRKFDATGTAETGVVELEANNASQITIAQGGDGNLLVAYLTAPNEITTRLINTSGTTIGGPTVVQTTSDGTYSGLHVVALSDGTYAIGATQTYTSGGSTDPSFVRVSSTGGVITNETVWDAANNLRAGDQQNIHLLAQSVGVRLFWNGVGNGDSTNIQTRFLTPILAPPIGISSISGLVQEDYDGDGVLDENIDIANVTVRLWADDGDGIVDGGDTFVTSTTTAADGTYAFAGLADGDYYVTFDSRTVESFTSLNTGFTQSDLWATQTVFDENAVTYNLPGNATANRPNRSDDATTLVTSNHVVAVTVSGADVTDVDAGFSFRAVTTTLDGDDDLANGRSVQGSLRQFIQNANAMTGAQQSLFDIEAGDANLDGSGYATITLASALPTLDGPTILDATDQTGWSNAPRVTIDGTGLASGSVLVAASNTVSITGFAIIGGPSHAIEVTGDNAFIHGNHIGVSADGATVNGATGSGILISGDSAQVGGSTLRNRNIIVASGDAGVFVDGGLDAVIIGNYIGVAADGVTEAGNEGAGIKLRGGTANTDIGFGSFGTRNVIAGNKGAGIDVLGDTGNLTIRGNLIGLNATGLASAGNATHGILIEGSSGTATIGGLAAEDKNYIAGNGGDGIAIRNQSAAVDVFGNFVGVATDGSTGFGNLHGISVTSASNVTVGQALAGNVVSGNGDDGVHLSNADQVTVAGNLIGLGADASTVVDNADDGIRVISGSSNITIGGSSAADANVIGGNVSSGVDVTNSSGVLIQNNLIGTDGAGTAVRGNGGQGINVAANTGQVTIDSNVIGGSSSHGVRIGDNTTGLTLTSNLIGVGADGTTDIGNTSDAILISNSSNVAVGLAGQGNTIANSHGSITAHGIQIEGSSAVTIVSNVIGLADDESIAAGNSGAGIDIRTSSDIQVGGLASGNVIAANRNGVVISTDATDVRIQGNLFGTDTTRSNDYRNSLNTIQVENNAANILIGGTSAGLGNHIEFADGTAIEILEVDAVSGAPSGVQMLRNTVGTTVSRTIDVVSNVDANAPVGANPNDALDADTGVNGIQNTPTLTSSRNEETRTRIAGTIQSTANSSIRIEAFASTNGLIGYGPAEIYLGTITVTTDASGHAGYVIYTNTVVPHGDSVTATATNVATGETSELALNIETTAATLVDLDPIAAGTGVSLSYAQGDGPRALAPTATVRDADSPNLTSATLFITNAADAIETLAVDTGATTIVANWNASTHVLTLTGLSSVADYEAVLRTVTYENSSATVTSGDRLIGVSMTDELMVGDYAYATVTVTAANAAPAISIPAAQDVVRSGILEFSSANGNAITFADGDAGNTDLELSIVASDAAVTFAATAGLTFISGDGTNDSVIVVRGTLSELNAAFEGATLSPDVGFDGPTSLVLSLDDLGGSGGDPKSDGAVLPINVLSTNSNPILSIPTLSIDENLPAGSLVGTVSATDPDPGDAVTFSLTNDAGGLFTIDSQSGEIRTTAPLDHETATTHSITIQAKDRPGITVQTTRTVTVNDLPDTIGVVTLSVPPLAVAENQAVGTLVGTATASDPTPGAVLTYSLDDDAGGLFTIDAVSGEIRTALTFNHEVAATRTIVVRVASTGGSSDVSSAAVAIQNVNETPALTASNATVSESIAVGSTVLTATAADPDAGDSMTFTLDNDAGGLFAIDSSTGVLTTASTLDFETATSHTVRIRVTDNGGLFSTQDVTITVTDANETPTLVATNATVSEAIAVGSTVLTATAADPDAGDSVTFTLDNDAGGLFAIDAVTGAVTTRSALDFESVSLHSVRVRATDAGGLFATQDVDIAVTNANESPALTVPGLSVAESAAIGTVIGTATVSDPDAGDSHTFSLDDTAGNRFAIDATTGVISTTALLDFESHSTHTIIVRVADAGGRAATVTRTVNVTDSNESPSLSVSALTAAENQPAGTVVGTASVSDADVGDTHTFSLVDDGGGLFAIDGASGQITTTAPLDFESNASVDLVIRVTDSATNSSTILASVAVTNVNESPTPVVGPLSLGEATTNGSVVGTVGVSDPDAGDSHTYGLTDDAGGLFAIDSLTGVVTTAGAFDFETASAHTITIQVTDAAGSTGSVTRSVTITDVNEGPSISVTPLVVPENNPVGAAVGSASVSDPDRFDTHTFSLVDDAGGRFAIDSITGAISATQSFDFETFVPATVVVRVTDAAGLTASISQTVVIQDANEAPALSVVSFDVDERQPAGEVAAIASVTDPDAGDVHTFALVDDAGGRFAIDSTSGVVTTTGPLSFDSAASHSIQIVVGDGAGEFTIQAVTISVNEVLVAPTLSLAPSFAVAETALAGTIVGQAVGTTAAGSGPLVYALTSDAGNRFAIDASSGQIRVLGPLDFEQAATHDLTVSVTNGDGLTASRSTTISVTDVNELVTIDAPTMILGTEDTPTRLDAVSVANPEIAEVLTATWSVVGGSAEINRASFVGTVSELNNALSSTIVTPDADFDGTTMVRMTIVDEDGRAESTDVEIRHTAVNDAPVAVGEAFTVTAFDTLDLSFADLLANDRDVDSALLEIELGPSPQVGTLAVSATGLTFTVEDATFTGDIALAYRVTDGAATSPFVSITVSVEQLAVAPPSAPSPVSGNNSSSSPVPVAPSVPADPGSNQQSPSSSPGSTTTVSPSTPTAVAPPTAMAGSGSAPTTDVVAPVAVVVTAPATPDLVVEATTSPAEGQAGEPEVFYLVSMTDSAIEGLEAGESTKDGPKDRGSDTRPETDTDGERRTGRRSIGERRSVNSASDFEIEPPRLIIEQPAMFEHLDRAVEDITQLKRQRAYVAGSAVVTSTAMTIGYAVWTARGGYLLASVMSAMPTWRFIDPMLVLSDFGSLEQRELDDDLSLAELLNE